MKRLSPEERKYISHQTLVRLQKDWVCRYGHWNTAKLLGELRRMLRKASRPGGLDTAVEPEPVAAEEALPLFAELPA